MNFSLQQLRHFLAVAEAGSLGKAAALVHVSQPALTKSMHKLEEGLGLQLFDRDGPMKVSAVGREFLAKARRLLAESAELSQEVMRLTRATSGHVAVGCGPLLPEALVAPAVADLIRQNRALSVTIDIGSWPDFAPLLRSGRLDFFVANVTMLQDEPDLEITAFPPEPAVWFARPGHPLAGRRRIPPAEFFAHSFAGPVLPAWIDDWFQRQAGATPDAPFRFAVTCSHYPALKAILHGSDCVTGAILPIVMRDFQEGSMVPLDVDLPPLTMQAGLIWLRHRKLSPAAYALIDGIKRHVNVVAGGQSPVREPRQSLAPTRKNGPSRKE
jgi:DNA-binding transcriptional LysR family regulator